MKKEIAIGITGSPGTGKKTVGKELAKLLDYDLILLNDLAIEHGKGKWAGSTFQVDTRKLAKMNIKTKGAIVVGHLLPFVVQRNKIDFVAVLRCSPFTLKQRYSKRRYSKKKVAQNIEAELLDLVSFSSLQVFGRKKIAEFDTTETRPDLVAKKIVQTINGTRARHYGLNTWSNKAALSSQQLSSILSPLGSSHKERNR